MEFYRELSINLLIIWAASVVLGWVIVTVQVNNDDAYREKYNVYGFILVTLSAKAVVTAPLFVASSIVIGVIAGIKALTWPKT